jgi:hypothetical protein
MLSKKAEIHVSVEEGKWVKQEVLGITKSDESLPLANGTGTVPSKGFRFLFDGTEAGRVPGFAVGEIREIDQAAMLANEARDLVAKGKIVAVFKLLKDKLDDRASIYTDLIQLEGRQSRNQDSFLRGIISHVETNLESDRISYGLLHLVSQLEEKDLGSGGSAAKH